MTGDVFFDVTKPQYFIKLMTVLSISIHAFGRLFVSFCRRLMSHVVCSIYHILSTKLLFAFIFDTAGGVLFAKFLNLFLKKKINPMIGAAGISAFPMSGRIVHKMGLQEDPQNFLLMHSIGVNVSGQIASVIAGGLILMFFAH